MEGDQSQAPSHGYVRQGIGEEPGATTGGRDAEDHNSGLSGLWETFGGGVRVKITLVGAHRFR